MLPKHGRKPVLDGLCEHPQARCFIPRTGMAHVRGKSRKPQVWGGLRAPPGGSLAQHRSSDEKDKTLRPESASLDKVSGALRHETGEAKHYLRKDDWYGPPLFFNTPSGGGLNPPDANFKGGEDEGRTSGRCSSPHGRWRISQGVPHMPRKSPRPFHRDCE